MSVTGEAINILEGEAERLLWFPVITLGYIFTLSGDQLDFLLAAGAIAGIRLIQRIMDSLEISPEDSIFDIISILANWGAKTLNGRITVVYTIVVLFYAAAVVHSLERLYTHFAHADIVLVGLSVFICGSTGVVLMNVMVNLLE